MLRTLFAIFTFFILVTAAAAQDVLEYPGRPRYPEGLLAVQLGIGAAKYAGEFSDETTGRMLSVRAMYSVSPGISVGLNAENGDGVYHRRERRTTSTAYAYQFPRDNNVLRSTPFTAFHIMAAVDFFPRMYFNGYFFVGAGVTLYKPQDYSDNAVRYRPKNDNLASFTVPGGLGADLFLGRNFSVNVEFAYHMLLADNFDAFPSAEIRDTFLPGAIKPESIESADDGADGYFSLTAGLKIFLFENPDLDGDMLGNREEEALKISPYDSDTDGDGLGDYEEVRVQHTNPLVRDTDEDGLNDYVEAIKYHTDPLKKDTDGDGLGDAEEVQRYSTNPLVPDSDSDGLRDGREVLLGTNPNAVDSDRDALTDFEEVEQVGSHPLKPDTDGDELTDFEEAREYGTDPLRADTDRDGLPDGEEVRRTRTNPLAADTDGDMLTDFAELKTVGTDPLRKDTDSDGFSDNVDTCPLLAETYNGYHDEDGCPDTPRGDVAVGPGGVAARGGGDGTTGAPGASMQRMDTLLIHEGEILTLFGVNFEVDKDVIRPESYPILEENAKLFSLYPTLVVEIRGHTDSDASEAYNRGLSERRAESVKNFLVERGVAPERMLTKGFGFSAPVAPNTDIIGKARNRRIEFFIVKSGERAIRNFDDVPVEKTKQVKIKGRVRRR
ncbi:MAG: OmpA family protein [Ignavibacteria bacterium]|nr:OmpA family protein [Ignavibacteria bacterium]